MQHSALRFEQVTYAVNPSQVIFREASFEIAAHEFVLIVGPSGCGKSTLLKLLTGQLQAKSGGIEVLGQSIESLSIAEQQSLRRCVGMLFQNGALFTDLSVFENVAFPLREHTKLDATTLTQAVSAQLKEVGLEHAQHLMPHQLSGGMTRRVALARAMILKPDILLYDEPLTGQDPVTIHTLVSLMKRLHTHRKMTSVVVSHQIRALLPYVDRVLMVRDGAVLDCGPPNGLAHHADTQVRHFFQGELDVAKA